MSRGEGQTGLGPQSAVAVVEAGGYSSNSTPGLGTSTCDRCGPKRTTMYLFMYSFFLGPHLQHVEAPRLTVKLEL